MSKITRMQRSFALEFLVDGDATKAAIRAGYSPNGAAVTGHRLLRHPNVVAVIQEMTGKPPLLAGKVGAKHSVEPITTVDRAYVVGMLKKIAESRRSSTMEKLNALGKLSKFVGFGGNQPISTRTPQLRKKPAIDAVKAAAAASPVPEDDDDGLSAAMSGTVRH